MRNPREDKLVELGLELLDMLSINVLNIIDGEQQPAIDHTRIF